jgi:acyl transferase domain-containing protein
MPDDLTPLQRAMLAVERLQAKLDASERARHEPIAVVGMSCRMPGGADSPARLWRLLCDGVVAVGETPRHRWPEAPPLDRDVDRSALWGGFLPAIDLFDREFFGINPRRAAAMDPQQRLGLELAWEAFEAAGIPQERFAGTTTGVYVGGATSEYAWLHFADPDEMGIEASAACFLSSRLSHQLDLRGPCLTLDSACSSSLQTIHLAAQALRTRDCDLALAGGIGLMLAREAMQAFARNQMLASDGQPRVFDVAGDGFVRAEGGGFVVLERLSDAIAAGDPILAVIRGTAVNQDGRAGAFGASSREAQRAVIARALDDAGLPPSAIGYLEANGVGAALADAAEVQTLAAVLAPGRTPAQRCAIGTIKANVGHLSSAAGVAGFIKTVLCLQHGYVPRHVGLRTLNPEIDLAGTPLLIPVEGTEWPHDACPRAAGVSTFGYGGTNAHAVLVEAPARDAVVPPAEGEVYVLPISARSPAALSALAAAFAARLQEDDASLAALVYSAGTRRTHHRHRLAILGDSRAALGTRLTAFARGTAGLELANGLVPAEAPHVAFVFEDAAGEAETARWRAWGITPQMQVARDDVRRAIDEGCSIFLGLGGCRTPDTPVPVWISGAGCRRSQLEALARLYVLGCRVDWAALHPHALPAVPLPTYPWQRQRYWLKPRPR